MNKPLLFTALLTVAGIAGCSYSEVERQGNDKVQFVRAEGDKTIYALASDNTSDSILVFLTLPYDGEDPDTMDILQARRNRQIFGRVNVGDMIAILPNEEDSVGEATPSDSAALVVERLPSAKRVIVLEDFFGQWFYEVHPRLRRHVPDSVVLPHRIQEMLNTSCEYSITLKPDNMMFSMGAQRGTTSEDDMLPVVYPKPKRYTQWAIYNGRLVLTESVRDSTDQNSAIGTDTVEFVRLRRDTLILRFPDGEHTYYKKESE